MGCASALGLRHKTQSLIPPATRSELFTLFRNDNLPCKVQSLPCRLNHHSRNRVNSSLLATGGWREVPSPSIPSPSKTGFIFCAWQACEKNACGVVGKSVSCSGVRKSRSGFPVRFSSHLVQNLLSGFVVGISGECEDPHRTWLTVGGSAVGRPRRPVFPTPAPTNKRWSELCSWTTLRAFLCPRGWKTTSTLSTCSCPSYLSHSAAVTRSNENA